MIKGQVTWCRCWFLSIQTFSNCCCHCNDCSGRNSGCEFWEHLVLLFPCSKGRFFFLQIVHISIKKIWELIHCGYLRKRCWNVSMQLKTKYWCEDNQVKVMLALQCPLCHKAHSGCSMLNGLATRVTMQLSSRNPQVMMQHLQPAKEGKRADDEHKDTAFKSTLLKGFFYQLLFWVCQEGFGAFQSLAKRTKTRIFKWKDANGQSSS